MIQQIAEIGFWACVAVLGYTFVGYPLLIRLIAAVNTTERMSARSSTPATSSEQQSNAPVKPALSLNSRNGDRDAPMVSVVLCAHNEDQRILARIRNLLSADYRPDRLEVVVVSDGSTDRTAAHAARLRDARVRVVEEPIRRGKAQAINRALGLAAGEIIVFADSRQRFAQDAIRFLVDRFSDSRVGAVSGSLEIEPAASGVGKGIDAYWKFEKWLRLSESAVGATIGCTGAIYAIRKKLFHPLSADTLLDDVVLPMQVLTAGHRVVFEPRAVAYDPQALEPGTERARKRRTLAGNYQMLFRFPYWLLPWRNRSWWQLLSHKYLRLASPWLLIAAALANIALAGSEFYRWTLGAQFILYALATAGLLRPGIRSRLVSIPAGFAFLNLMTVSGLFWYLRKDLLAGWQPSASVAASTTGETHVQGA